ncbi:MAG: hypothetical protein DI533_21745 [Cereibacter sphaeroides]|uniref:Uncharacterized protein n=1 Tax=Cereibacter sphaeroides TaxID=1063 RepID=A0A2W5RVG5_CERSP|nr:MAG: hypothetical protein DI533_21745 [Cereibacter sphaeroides]
MNVIEEQRSFYQADLTRFVIELGTVVRRAIRDESAGTAKRLNDLREFIDDNPGYETGEMSIEEAVIQKALSFMPRKGSAAPWVPEAQPSASQVRLVHLLNQDGFAVTDRVLTPSLPSDIDLPGVQSELFRLLDKHHFLTPKSHLEQALENHARGNWSSSNGQLRNFIEGLLDEIAVRISPSAADIRPGNDRRAHLAVGDEPFLSSALGEWSGDGKNFVNGLMKRLHPAGAHPGLSDEEDSSFRLHVVLLTGNLFLKRYDRWPT